MAGIQVPVVFQYIYKPLSIMKNVCYYYFFHIICTGLEMRHCQYERNSQRHLPIIPLALYLNTVHFIYYFAELVFPKQAS